jgi:hypothetical protein
MDFIKNLDRKLEGAPNNVLTASLILAGIIAWIVAIFMNPTTKAAVLSWMILP